MDKTTAGLWAMSLMAFVLGMIQIADGFKEIGKGLGETGKGLQDWVKLERDKWEKKEGGN